jgi:signal transduction histidine kinase
MEAMQMGVADFLSKSEVSASLLDRTIRYAILQKQNQDALLAAKEELEARVKARTRELTELQRRLIDRAENERLELARDLHDGPMQELYGLVFQLDALPGDFAAGEGEQAVEAIKDQLQQTINSLRSISRELRPPALAPYGLEKAIRSHVDALRSVHPEMLFNLHLDPDRQTLPEPVRMALFRIYQTAISNALRHARATRIEVEFRLDDASARLEIRDNGRGFDLPRSWITLARQGHMGLVGAAERAEAAGGRLEVESQPGKGAIIRVVVPRAKTGERG